LAAPERPTDLGTELGAALAAIGGFEPRPLLAVGVSGGPDSMALVIVADRWARQRGGTVWGLIVDHRLRPESAAEAARVASWLEARGIHHVTLVWTGEKPTTGIQEAAREARYRLLAGWCAEQGCLHLLTAHHRDDQAETYMIRHRARSGVDGLAGMSAVRELPHLRLVRPLLGVPKARLVAFLGAERQDYLQDPSNRNPAFERSRLRLATETPLPCLPEESVSRREARVEREAKIRREVGHHAVGRIAREREVARLLARAVTLHPAGFALIDPAPVAAAGEPGEQALGRVVMVLGGAAYPVRRERLRRLREALAETPCRARTLGGCRFVPWRGRVLVLREAARVASPVTLAPGGAALWDRRFLATLPIAAPRSVTVGALGTEEAGLLEKEAIGDDNPLPRLVYPVLPAIRDASGVAAVPHLCWRHATAECVVSLNFRPPVSLFGAGFTVV
jgi:tRNA(Ile)-lysidine synthase